MKSSYKVGFSFGTVSGVISTLGLMVGLDSGTDSRLAVVGGIVMIAIADSFSDALSMHVSEEWQKSTNDKSIWQMTIATFVSKVIIALSFLVPFPFLEMPQAIIVNIIWGMSLIVAINYFVAKSRGVPVAKIIIEHLLVAFLVIVITYLVGWAVRDYLLGL